jgi:cytochrome P450
MPSIGHTTPPSPDAQVLDPRGPTGGLQARVSETRAFLRGWRRYFEERRATYGSGVFRTCIVGPAVSILDVAGFEVLFDTARVRKCYGFGPAIPRRDLVGRITPTVFANGSAHEAQKRVLLSLIEGAAPRLEPTLGGLADDAFDRWASLPKPLDWGREMDGLLITCLFEWLLGARPDLDDVRAWGDAILSPVPLDVPPVFAAAPRPARAARDRLLAVVRGAPAFAGAARLAREQAGWTEDESAKQLLFMLAFNAWGGLHGALPSLVAELTLNDGVRRAIRQEARAASPASAPGMAALARMPILRGAVAETLRLHGPVPFAYGQAITDLVVQSHTGSYRVRAGEMLQGVFWMAGLDPRVFPDPERFDPARHADPAARRAVLWANGPADVPTAPGNKVCAGQDVVVQILAFLAARLVAGWDWSLSDTPRWSQARVILANRPETPMTLTSFGRVV